MLLKFCRFKETQEFCGEFVGLEHILLFLCFDSYFEETHSSLFDSITTCIKVHIIVMPFKHNIQLKICFAFGVLIVKKPKDVKIDTIIQLL